MREASPLKLMKLRRALGPKDVAINGSKGSPAYTTAKHGVIGLTRAAALDYAAQNVRVNAVCPAISIPQWWLASPAGPPRGGQASSRRSQSEGGDGPKRSPIANAVLWLCSDASDFVIGSAMVVDGGQTIQ